MKHLLLPCLLAPLTFGCLDADDVVLDADLAETAQEVAGTNLNSYTCSSTPYCTYNLGTTTNRACFLGGVRGAAGPGSLVGIQASGSSYQLTIFPPSLGQTITVTTVCVNPASNITTTAWTTNFGVPSQQIPNTTLSSKCFLTKFSSQAGGMTNYNDSIRTWRDSSGKWYLGGSAASGYLSGAAICFDASNMGTWSWGQGVPGSITGNLASNAAGGVACGLTELGGNFTTGSSSDGVHIGYNSAAAQWVWTLKNFKHAHAACIK